jgi:cysteine-rich repeat protein
LNLNGETCLTRGFDGGSLSCSSCSFDTSSCTLETCGDGVIDTGEECDDSNTTAGDGCGSDCQIEQGFECTGEPSVCTALPVCGDGTADPNEACDGDDLKGATCESLGFDSGTLTCTAGCAFDTSQCEGTPLPPVEVLTPGTCEVSGNEWGLEPSVTAGTEVCEINFYVAGRENSPYYYEFDNMTLTLRTDFAEGPAEGEIFGQSNGNDYGFYSSGVFMGVEGTEWRRIPTVIETDSGAIHKGGLYRCEQGMTWVENENFNREIPAVNEVLVDYDLGLIVDDDTQPPPGGNCNNGCSSAGGALPSGGMILVFLIVIAFLLLQRRMQTARVKVRSNRRRR